ncbi:MEMO1 family protein [Picrophilus oshimae]|uniref:MEMO1 family protein SAMN02745355_0006 n=1 Tax=Picrophilus torridus (strain ATCC 700027 / DSM 9790 / JCM 10055 / NBRC 100828 / KAW 2/3) TaxID=1122961 RepID=A0A8G2L6P2_PICTO|nr:MEMO1 family protein [Picrophilus oshimae]SMD30145.1 hypothetical protein SAMN02745355_0006 [Picrophilus oshimae DSM 9789]
MIRDPYVAGAFYPDSESELLNYFKNLEPERFDIKFNKILGVVVPHAGYEYSGKIAWASYSILKEYNARRFLIIGPNHYGYPFYPAIYSNGSWRTPLGDSIIDNELSEQLIMKSGIIKSDPETHSTEHSIEVQLPFLQYIFKNQFTFVPLILGDQSYEISRDLGETILSLDRIPLIIASSDLNHYESYDKNNEKDEIIINDIINLRIKDFFNDIYKYRITACGFGAIAVLMYITKKNHGKIALLRHANSGDASGDRRRVVGYAAMLAYS